MKMKEMLNHTNAELKQANAEQKTNHFASKFPLSDGIRKVMAGIAIVSALNFGSGLVSKADLFVKSAYAQEKKESELSRVIDRTTIMADRGEYIEIIDLENKVYNVEYRNGVLTFRHFKHEGKEYTLEFDFREGNLREFAKKKLNLLSHVKKDEEYRIWLEYDDDTALLVKPRIENGRARINAFIIDVKNTYDWPKTYDEVVEEGARKVYDVAYNENEYLLVFKRWYKGRVDVTIHLKQLLEPYKDAKIRRIKHAHDEKNGDAVILQFGGEGNWYDVALVIRPVIERDKYLGYNEVYSGYEYLLVYNSEKYGKR